MRKLGGAASASLVYPGRETLADQPRDDQHHALDAEGDEERKNRLLREVPHAVPGGPAGRDGQHDARQAKEAQPPVVDERIREALGKPLADLTEQPDNGDREDADADPRPQVVPLPGGTVNQISQIHEVYSVPPLACRMGKQLASTGSVPCAFDASRPVISGRRSIMIWASCRLKPTKLQLYVADECRKRTYAPSCGQSCTPNHRASDI